MKVLGSDMAVDEAWFSCEVERISDVRHPNLAVLMGTFSEVHAVTYEIVLGRSLENHLDLSAVGRCSLP